MLKRFIPIALAGPLILAATACTPQQIADWQAWHDKDPAAAEAYANQPDVQALVVQDWDHDGVIEPDSPTIHQTSTTTTRTTTQHKTTKTKPKTTTTRSSTSTRSTGASGVNWDRVAQCESGQQWGHGVVHNSVGSFSGGLMIMNSAWRSFGGTQFAPTAGQASRAEQIVVAERIAARVGAARAWQCPVG